MQIFAKKKSFKREFKRQIRMAITAAVGFTIAFAWRNAVFDTFLNFVAKFLDVEKNHYLTESYTAILITFIGVIIIYFSSKILRD